MAEITVLPNGAVRAPNGWTKQMPVLVWDWMCCYDMISAESFAIGELHRTAGEESCLRLPGNATTVGCLG